MNVYITHDDLDTDGSPILMGFGDFFGFHLPELHLHTS